MTKKKNIILILAIIALGLLIYVVNGANKEMVIDEGFLDLSEIDYLEVFGIDKPIKITDQEDIQEIVLLLHQLNGPIEVEHLPYDEALLGVSIVLKGHYPSSSILIYEDRIFHGQGRNVSEAIVNELIIAIESTF